VVVVVVVAAAAAAADDDDAETGAKLINNASDYQTSVLYWTYRTTIILTLTSPSPFVRLRVSPMHY